MARRPSTTPPSDSTTTAVATFWSRHSTNSSLGQASTSRPSMMRGTSAAPQLTQKCPIPGGLYEVGGPGRLGVLLADRHAHVRHAHLVATALLRGVQGPVRVLHEAREKGGVVGRR